MLTRRRTLTLAASALAPAVLGRTARAQGWPNRPVRIIVPYPAGGGADAIARIVGRKLTEMWGQQVTIENKGGAGGNIASDAAAKLDARRLHDVSRRRIPHHQSARLSEALLRSDRRPRSRSPLVVQYPTVVALPNSSPAKTVQEFIAYAKAQHPAAPSPRRVTAPARISPASCSSAPPASS